MEKHGPLFSHGKTNSSEWQFTILEQKILKQSSKPVANGTDFNSQRCFEWHKFFINQFL